MKCKNWETLKIIASPVGAIYRENMSPATISMAGTTAANIALLALSEKALGDLAQHPETADAASEYCETSGIFAQFVTKENPALLRTARRFGSEVPAPAWAHLLHDKKPFLRETPSWKSAAEFLPALAGSATAEGTLAMKNFFGLEGRGVTILFGTALFTPFVIQLIEIYRTGNRDTDSSWENILLGTAAAAGSAWLLWNEGGIGEAGLAAGGLWFAGTLLFTTVSRWWTGRARKNLEELNRMVHESLTKEVMAKFFAEQPYFLMYFLGNDLPTRLNMQISKRQAAIQKWGYRIRTLENEIERTNNNALLEESEKRALERGNREKIERAERRIEKAWKKIGRLQEMLEKVKGLRENTGRIVADAEHLKTIEVATATVH